VLDVLAPLRLVEERRSGDKYDSSHALKHESYLILRGVHSALRLCAIRATTAARGGFEKRGSGPSWHRTVAGQVVDAVSASTN
jgi:hypothetical protein